MEKTFPDFEYGISSIVDCGFIIDETVNATLETSGLGYAMNFIFDVANSFIEYTIRADFKEMASNKLFLSGRVRSRFSIYKLENFLDENNKVSFPDGSLELLFGIAFGHLRAILTKNSAGSKFNFAIIPIVDPNVLFNELLQININMFRKGLSQEQLDEIDKIAFLNNQKIKEARK